MDARTKARLIDLTKRVLHENSGGAKFTTLVAGVLHLLGNEDLPDFKFSAFVEEFEVLLEGLNHEGIHIINYDWDISGSGRGPVRSKAFVYTKY